MKKNNNKIKIITKIPMRKENKANFKIKLSQYSHLYRKYMIKQFAPVEVMLKRIIKMPFCEKYYLHYPLESLMKGAIKKMLLNNYQTIIFGYFLYHNDQWHIESNIFSNVAEIFPDIIHVNQPTNPTELKEISMFLYFSAYSVKELLNGNIQLYKKEMEKLFPDFDHLLTHWVNSQHTVNFTINPKILNEFVKKLYKNQIYVDYNTCVDRIIHISPCYDISGRNKGQEALTFGYMESGYEKPIIYNEGNGVKMQELSDVQMMDFKYDGNQI